MVSVLSVEHRERIRLLSLPHSGIHSQLLGVCSIRESCLNVGQVPPVCTRGHRDVPHAGCHQRVHLLADVVIEDRLELVASNLHKWEERERRMS